MSPLSLRLPNSLHDRIRELAEAAGVSINQFIATAAAEKIAALMTDNYLGERGDRVSHARFRKALSRNQVVPPIQKTSDSLGCITDAVLLRGCIGVTFAGEASQRCAALCNVDPWSSSKKANHIVGKTFYG